MGDFLVGLNQITAQATACLDGIDGEVSLNVVSFTNLTLLDELEEPWQADAAREPESQASSVDWRETGKVRVFAQPVVSLAEGDAWAAASDQACINWSEAGKEAVGPAVGAGGWLCDGLWLVQGVLESTNPSIDIIGVDGGRNGVLLWGSHF